MLSLSRNIRREWDNAGQVVSRMCTSFKIFQSMIGVLSCRWFVRRRHDGYTEAERAALVCSHDNEGAEELFRLSVFA